MTATEVLKRLGLDFDTAEKITAIEHDETFEGDVSFHIEGRDSVTLRASKGDSLGDAVNEIREHILDNVGPTKMVSYGRTEAKPTFFRPPAV